MNFKDVEAKVNRVKTLEQLRSSMVFGSGGAIVSSDAYHAPSITFPNGDRFRGKLVGLIDAELALCLKEMEGWSETKQVNLIDEIIKAEKANPKKEDVK